MLYFKNKEEYMGLDFNHKKMTQTSNYLIHQLGSLYKTRLIKLIFIADRLHFRKYARTITGDSYEAQQYGPVTVKALELIHAVADDEDAGVEVSYFKNFLNIQPSHPFSSKKKISSRKEVDTKVLSETDMEILDAVIDKFGSMSAEELIKYTHQLPEWKDLYKEKEVWKAIELSQFIDKSLDKNDEASDYAKDVVLK